MNKRRVNTFLFFFFVGGFLLSAPAIVLFTAGYRWNPSTGFVRTGSIFVTSQPKGARILIDDTERAGTTPQVVRKLRRGEHNVRLELEGFIPWEKDLFVDRGETTFIDHVPLYLDADSRILIGNIQSDISWSPDDSQIIWPVHEEGWTEIWTSELSRPTPRLLYRSQQAESFSATWRYDNTIVLSDEATATYLLPNGEVGNEEISSRVFLRLRDNATDIAYKNGSVIATIPNTDHFIADESDDYLVVQDRSSSLSLIDTNNPTAPLLVRDTGISWDWHEDGRFVYTDGLAITIYDPSIHKSTTITRLSDPIHHVRWHPTGRAILFSTDTQVRSIEIDERDERVVTILSTFNHVDSFGLDPRGRELYIFAQNDTDSGVFLRELR